MAEKKSSKSEVLESGNIYFIFRPKVEEHQPKGVQDVERFYLVLSPEGKKVYRMIIVGQKTLPGVRHLQRPEAEALPAPRGAALQG